MKQKLLGGFVVVVGIDDVVVVIVVVVVDDGEFVIVVDVSDVDGVVVVVDFAGLRIINFNSRAKVIIKIAIATVTQIMIMERLDNR